MDTSQIEILTDENISASVVKYLRKKGIKVLDVKEQNWHGKTDIFLLEQSCVNKQFVLTHDSDFGTLAAGNNHNFHGIIFLRMKNQQPNNVVKALEKFFDLDVKITPNSLIVIKEIQSDDLIVRIRNKTQNLE